MMLSDTATAILRRLRHSFLRPALRMLLELRRSARSSEFAVIGIATFVGIPVGLMIGVLHRLISILNSVVFDLPLGVHLSEQEYVKPELAIGVPLIGGLVLAVTRFFLTRKRDIADPIEANALFSGRMSVPDSLRLTLSTFTSNVAGASVGMEAGYTQLGAAVFSAHARYLRLRREDCRIFVTAGAAAAISAAFNAPLAGAFYGFELVHGSYTPRALAPVALASLTGAAMVRLWSRHQAELFHVTETLHVAPWLYAVCVALGVAAALIGIVTMRAATLVESGLRKAAPFDWLRPVVGGLTMGILAAVAPQVLGSGQGAIQYHLEHHWPMAALFFLLLAKMLASALGLGSGFRGGLFSSSLLLGCLLGGLVSTVLLALFPDTTSQQTVLQLVGMGAVGAAIIGAPLCMVFLVLESTGDLPVTIAVLTAVVTASTIVRIQFGYSFATWRFHLRGLPLRGGYDVGWVKELKVGGLMRSDAKTVDTGMPIARLRGDLAGERVTHVFVVDSDGRFQGTIEAALLFDPDVEVAQATLVAADVSTGKDNFLLPQDDIQAALARFDALKVEVLPVLDSGEARSVVGYLTEALALRRYSEALERRRGEDLGMPSKSEIGARV